MSAIERVAAVLSAVENDEGGVPAYLFRVHTPDGPVDLNYDDVTVLLLQAQAHEDQTDAIYFRTHGRSAVALLWEGPDGAIFFDDARDDTFDSLRLTRLERTLFAERLHYVANQLLRPPRLIIPTEGDRP